MQAQAAVKAKPAAANKPDSLSSAAMEEIGFSALRSASALSADENVQVSPLALFSTLVTLQQAGGPTGQSVKKALMGYGVAASFKPRAYDARIKQLTQSQEHLEIEFGSSRDKSATLISKTAIHWPWNEILDSRYETANSSFFTADGHKVFTSTFEVLNNFDYLETLEFQAVRLQAKSRALSLYIFLPHVGVDLNLVVDQFTGANWNLWKRGFSNSVVDLQLPRFTVESKGTLSSSLCPQSINSAVFGGKGTVSWQMKTSLVDEQTGVVTALNRQLANSKSMTLRRPFVFVLTDDATGTLLDVGVFHRPERGMDFAETHSAGCGANSVGINSQLKKTPSKSGSNSEVAVLSRLADFEHTAGNYSEEELFLAELLYRDVVDDFDIPVYAGAFVRRIAVLHKLGRDADAELAASQRQSMLSALGLATESFRYQNANASLSRPIRVQAQRKMGNIAPYREDVLSKIADFWHPENPHSILLLLTLSPEGVLLDRSILESSGLGAIDDEALAAVSKVRYSPLPLWYKADRLYFKIHLGLSTEDTDAPSAEGRSADNSKFHSFRWIDSSPFRSGCHRL